ncbi:MAG: DeoR/GlpR family DNA-binding transcription regulator [Spirochaetales bacterium]|uniref:DeoR/GlpR family DNA-binding transcription regulator n=1 Tax=Candidatus Thalassospirochaeta sargassi TaxID=3119039 RepID=A0AAJ1MIN4_9SPIO|nr:DeoR/GlpR family DNA-binding transcription regulator [Spirochaetales bacterium]
MAEKRIEEIKELLRTKGRVYVNDLSARFNVSEVSVRKYLSKLEADGVADRFYGGASLSAPASSLEQAEGFYANPLLQSLASTARRQIADGDSIFIGSGRSCSVLARMLTGLENLTVVTNNITAMTDIIKNAARVYTLGGEVTTTDGITQFSSWESPENLLKNIFVNKAFTSTSGLDLKAGLTVDSVISSYIFKHIPSMSHRWYLLADSSKFGKISIYSVAELNQLDSVISDNIPADYLQSFKKQGIDVIEISS